MYEKYLSEIKFIRFQKTIDESKNIYWMTGILISSKSPISKKMLIKKLIKKGIETRSFFMSMREQPCLKIFFNKDKKNSTPVSNNLWKNALYLPSSHNLNAKKIKSAEWLLKYRELEDKRLEEESKRAEEIEKTLKQSASLDLNDSASSNKDSSKVLGCK
jgi:dTDP-4-amino-4,6-dideoxygalactose transaminase